MKTLALQLAGGKVALVTLLGAAAVAYGDLARALGVPRRALKAVSEALIAMASDPEHGWLTSAIASLRVGTWALFVAEVEAAPGVPSDLSALREQGLAATARGIDEAKRHGLVRRDADPRHIQVGLGAVSWPLPEALLREVPGLEHWLLETYLRGIAPRPL